jgi:hypothetical protein
VHPVQEKCVKSLTAPIAAEVHPLTERVGSARVHCVTSSVTEFRSPGLFEIVLL